MNVKKDFVELVSFLQANENKKVSTILEQIIDMCSKKNAGGANGSTVFKVDDKVVAIFCYYHKRWELVDHIAYGSKANTASGLNTMCKEGVSNWTKQQREAKKAQAELLAKVGSGEVTVESINDHTIDIENERHKIQSYELEDTKAFSFETVEELEAYLASK